MLGKIIISESQLKYLFNASEIHNYKDILNPNDLQNVPAVLRLVDKLMTCADNIENSRDQVCGELIYRYKNNPFVQLYVFVDDKYRSLKVQICISRHQQITISAVNVQYLNGDIPSCKVGDQPLSCLLEYFQDLICWINLFLC